MDNGQKFLTINKYLRVSLLYFFSVAELHKKMNMKTFAEINKQKKVETRKKLNQKK